MYVTINHYLKARPTSCKLQRQGCERKGKSSRQSVNIY